MATTASAESPVQPGKFGAFNLRDFGPHATACVPVSDALIQCNDRSPSKCITQRS